MGKGLFVKNTAWLIANKVVQLLLGLFINIFVTRYLGTTNYGIINYVNSYILFFSTFCQLGLSNIIVRELIVHKDEQGEVLGSAIGARVIVSIVCQLSFIGLMFYIGKDDPTVFYVGIVQSFSLVFNSLDLINHWYLSKMMAKRNAMFSFVAYIITAVYKIVLLVLKANIIWFASASVLDVAIIVIMLLIFYHVDKGDKLKFSFNRVKVLLKKSAPFILSELMIVIYGQTDKIMLGNMLDVDAVGLYTLAISTITLWQFIPIALLDSARPMIFEKYAEGSKDWIRYLRYLYSGISWLSILYGIFICLLGKYIILILYGNEFIGSVPVMRLSVWYMIFSYIGSCKNIYLIAIGKQKYEKYFTICSALLNIVLKLVLIPKWGIMGASFASLLTQIFVNVLMPLMFKDTRKHTEFFMQGLVFYGVFWGDGKVNVKKMMSSFKDAFNKRFKKKKDKVAVDSLTVSDEIDDNQTNNNEIVDNDNLNEDDNIKINDELNNINEDSSNIKDNIESKDESVEE